MPPGDFYPRPPRGGRRCPGLRLRPGRQISIHALREEGDSTSGILPVTQVAFLSTPSARRATASTCATTMCHKNFYPRPPRGGRHPDRLFRAFLFDFYPRPPRGGRLGFLYAFLRRFRFLSTPSARRATGYDLASAIARLISIHALREEGDDYLLRSCPIH